MAGMTALVCGGHGFIGHHLARRLRQEGYWVRTVDIQEYPYGDLEVDDYVIGDLRIFDVCREVFLAPGNKPFDEVYFLGAVMGGSGFIFTGTNDALVVHDSALININCAEMARRSGVGKVFFSSSACIYPQEIQTDPDNKGLREDMAYPANPDSPYGFEKLFSEQLYQAYARNHGMNIRIARFHNIYGAEGSWGNGREKSPAAICRKVAMAKDGDTIEIWGSGEQTRSFLYIDECLEAIRRFMDSDFRGPVNIGSEEMVSINQLVGIVKDIAGKPDIKINHVAGPIGVMGRCSENTLIKEKLGWAPDYPLRKGLEKTYEWIRGEVEMGHKDMGHGG